MSMLSESPIGRRVALALLGIAFVAASTAIVAYNALAPSEGVALAAGQVAPADILAPRSITYESEALTRLSRQAAADAIRDVYDPPNPGVLRQQVQLARHILDYIDNVRHDSYARPPQQQADLAAINAVRLPEDISARLLRLPDDDWKSIDVQVMSILERTMGDEIREENLDEVYANLPNRVSLAIDESQTSLITALVKDLIKPNTFYNEERTREAKRAAAAAVPAETRSFAQGQIVVRGGSIVTEADMEALAQLKLLQPPDRRLQMLVGASLSVVLVSALSFSYLRRFHPKLFHDAPTMILIGGLFLIFLWGSRIFATATTFQSYLFPAAALSLMLVALAGPQVAIAMTAALSVLIGLVLGNSLEFAALVAIGGTAGILSLSRIERLNAYFIAGLLIGVANVTIGLLFILVQGSAEPIRIVTVLIAGFLNGIISAGMAIVGLYLISSVLNVPTNVRLIELAQPSQHLLQRLLREAPGTYQHSLQVANLAELAAERIGANPLLTRVAALYHDIGKIGYPHFFVENQVEGVNPHDTLNDPLRSAQIIISHVTEGEKLARKYRLPAALIDVISQHHGTLSVLYFYNKALEAVNCDVTMVDKPAFCYPGPRPQTRESAILMLADACESIVRAKRPHNKEEIQDIVNEIVEMRMAENQLDNSHLTINDLKIIREVFVTTLQGVFHPRIVYPTVVPVPDSASPSASVITPGEAHP
jgi:cyclic-di-AMP phosphodiesterase PgpH